MFEQIWAKTHDVRVCFFIEYKINDVSISLFFIFFRVQTIIIEITIIDIKLTTVHSLCKM